MVRSIVNRIVSMVLTLMGTWLIVVLVGLVAIVLIANLT